MPPSDVNHPAVSAALSAAESLLGTEAVFIGGLTEDTFTLRRIEGSWMEVPEGHTLPRTDSFCHWMLAGAPNATADAGNDPAYRNTRSQTEFGIRSYIGVPITDADGTLLGTLCGIDRGAVHVGDGVVEVLRQLAGVVGAHLDPFDREHVAIRRTREGWLVDGGATPADLTSAMVLADLIDAELAPDARRTPDGELDELSRLRLSVSQLEHALAARVVVEQAIGVLAERQRIAPRSAFERLRKAARSRGRRVHDLAREVVVSVNDRTVPLPPELAPRR